MSIPSAIQIFKKKFPDATSPKSRVRLQRKHQEILDWWKGEAGSLGLRADRDWDRFVQALKADGVDLDPSIQIYSSSKLKIPKNWQTDYGVEKADKLTDALRLEGLRPLLVYLQNCNLSTRELADFVQDNFEVLAPFLPSMFGAGKFLELESALKQRGVTATKNSDRRIQFISTFESHVPGEASALKDDFGDVFCEASDHLATYINGEKNRIVTVGKEDEGKIWKYSLSLKRIARVARGLK